jgi:magnesium transporter
MIKAIYPINGATMIEYDSLKITEDYKKKPDLIWIDIRLENHELTSNEVTLLSKLFNFHEMSIEDCLFPQYYPKIEEFENYVFVAAHGIQLKQNYFQEFEDSIYELDFFIGKGFIVTLHTEELFFLETLFERAKMKPQVEMKNLEYMLYNIFNKVVSSYDITLEKIDDKMEFLEDTVLKSPETKNMEEILDVKNIVFTMRKIAEAQQAIYVYFTRANNNLIAEDYLVYFRDIYMQSVKMSKAVTMRSQTVVSLIEIYMSSVTIRLTEIMKFLAILATIALPALIVTGIFGMNLGFTTDRTIGIGFAAVPIVVCTIVLLVLFKRKRWL